MHPLQTLYLHEMSRSSAHIPRRTHLQPMPSRKYPSLRSGHLTFGAVGRTAYDGFEKFAYRPFLSSRLLCLHDNRIPDEHVEYAEYHSSVEHLRISLEPVIDRKRSNTRCHLRGISGAEARLLFPGSKRKISYRREACRS